MKKTLAILLLAVVRSACVRRRQVRSGDNRRRRPRAHDHRGHPEGDDAYVLAEHPRRRRAGGQGARRRRSSGAGRCARTIATRRSPKSKASSAAACRASCSRRSTKRRWCSRSTKRQTEDPGRHLRLRPQGRRLRQLRRDRQPQGRPAGRRAPRRRRSAARARSSCCATRKGTTARASASKGFLDAMKAHPGIEVVSSNQYGGADVEGRVQEGGVAPQQLQEAGRLARHRRHLHAERVDRRSPCCACCRTTAGRAR